MEAVYLTPITRRGELAPDDFACDTIRARRADIFSAASLYNASSGFLVVLGKDSDIVSTVVWYSHVLSLVVDKFGFPCSDAGGSCHTDDSTS